MNSATKLSRAKLPRKIKSTPEMARVADLRAHPREFRTHPADAIAHLVKAIRDHGFTRRVTIARDGTVLAGVDLVEAARKLKTKEVPAIRLDVAPDDPRAIKVMVSAERSHLDEVDDRALTELLKEVKDTAPGGLEGTGYDEMMLANLIFVTRPANEVKTFDAAAHWVGLPEYEVMPEPYCLSIRFHDEAARTEFIRKHDIELMRGARSRTAQAWWPAKRLSPPSDRRWVNGKAS